MEIATLHILLGVAIQDDIDAGWNVHKPIHCVEDTQVFQVPLVGYLLEYCILSYQEEYQRMTVRILGGFIVLPHWEIRLSEPLYEISLSHII